MDNSPFSDSDFRRNDIAKLTQNQFRRTAAGVLKTVATSDAEVLNPQISSRSSSAVFRDPLAPSFPTTSTSAPTNDNSNYSLKRTNYISPSLLLPSSAAREQEVVGENSNFSENTNNDGSPRRDYLVNEDNFFHLKRRHDNTSSNNDNNSNTAGNDDEMNSESYQKQIQEENEKYCEENRRNIFGKLSFGDDENDQQQNINSNDSKLSMPKRVGFSDYESDHNKNFHSFMLSSEGEHLQHELVEKDREQLSAVGTTSAINDDDDYSSSSRKVSQHNQFTELPSWQIGNDENDDDAPATAFLDKMRNQQQKNAKTQNNVDEILLTGDEEDDENHNNNNNNQDKHEVDSHSHYNNNNNPSLNPYTFLPKATTTTGNSKNNKNNNNMMTMLEKQHEEEVMEPMHAKRRENIIEKSIFPHLINPFEGFENFSQQTLNAPVGIEVPSSSSASATKRRNNISNNDFVSTDPNLHSGMNFTLSSSPSQVQTVQSIMNNHAHDRRQEHLKREELLQHSQYYQISQQQQKNQQQQNYPYSSSNNNTNLSSDVAGAAVTPTAWIRNSSSGFTIQQRSEATGKIGSVEQSGVVDAAAVAMKDPTLLRSSAASSVISHHRPNNFSTSRASSPGISNPNNNNPQHSVVLLGHEFTNNNNINSNNKSVSPSLVGTEDDVRSDLGVSNNNNNIKKQQEENDEGKKKKTPEKKQQETNNNNGNEKGNEDDEDEDDEGGFYVSPIQAVKWNQDAKTENNNNFDENKNGNENEEEEEDLERKPISLNLFDNNKKLDKNNIPEDQIRPEQYQDIVSGNAERRVISMRMQGAEKLGLVPQISNESNIQQGMNTGGSHHGMVFSVPIIGSSPHPKKLAHYPQQQQQQQQQFSTTAKTPQQKIPSQVSNYVALLHDETPPHHHHQQESSSAITKPSSHRKAVSFAEISDILDPNQKFANNQKVSGNSFITPGFLQEQQQKMPQKQIPSNNNKFSELPPLSSTSHSFLTPTAAKVLDKQLEGSPSRRNVVSMMSNNNNQEIENENDLERSNVDEVSFLLLDSQPQQNEYEEDQEIPSLPSEWVQENDKFRRNLAAKTIQQRQQEEFQQSQMDSQFLQNPQENSVRNKILSQMLPISERDENILHPQQEDFQDNNINENTSSSPIASTSPATTVSKNILRSSKIPSNILEDNNNQPSSSSTAAVVAGVPQFEDFEEIPEEMKFQNNDSPAQRAYSIQHARERGVAFLADISSSAAQNNNENADTLANNNSFGNLLLQQKQKQQQEEKENQEAEEKEKQLEKEKEEMKQYEENLVKESVIEAVVGKEEEEINYGECEEREEENEEENKEEENENEENDRYIKDVCNLPQELFVRAVQKFYEKHNPNKVGDVPILCKKYDREKVIGILEKKYNGKKPRCSKKVLARYHQPDLDVLISEEVKARREIVLEEEPPERRQLKENEKRGKKWALLSAWDYVEEPETTREEEEEQQQQQQQQPQQEEENNNININNNNVVENDSFVSQQEKEEASKNVSHFVETPPDTNLGRTSRSNSQPYNYNTSQQPRSRGNSQRNNNYNNNATRSRSPSSTSKLATVAVAALPVVAMAAAAAAVSKNPSVLNTAAKLFPSVLDNYNQQQQQQHQQQQNTSRPRSRGNSRSNSQQQQQQFPLNPSAAAANLLLQQSGASPEQILKSAGANLPFTSPLASPVYSPQNNNQSQQQQQSPQSLFPFSPADLKQENMRHHHATPEVPINSNRPVFSTDSLFTTPARQLPGHYERRREEDLQSNPSLGAFLGSTTDTSSPNKPNYYDGGDSSHNNNANGNYFNSPDHHQEQQRSISPSPSRVVKTVLIKKKVPNSSSNQHWGKLQDAVVKKKEMPHQQQQEQQEQIPKKEQQGVVQDDNNTNTNNNNNLVSAVPMSQPLQEVVETRKEMEQQQQLQEEKRENKKEEEGNENENEIVPFEQDALPSNPVSMNHNVNNNKAEEKRNEKQEQQQEEEKKTTNDEEEQESPSQQQQQQQEDQEENVQEEEENDQPKEDNEDNDDFEEIAPEAEHLTLRECRRTAVITEKLHRLRREISYFRPCKQRHVAIWNDYILVYDEDADPNSVPCEKALRLIVQKTQKESSSSNTNSPTTAAASNNNDDDSPNRSSSSPSSSTSPTKNSQQQQHHYYVAAPLLTRDDPATAKHCPSSVKWPLAIGNNWNNYPQSQPLVLSFASRSHRDQWYEAIVAIQQRSLRRQQMIQHQKQIRREQAQEHWHYLQQQRKQRQQQQQMLEQDQHQLPLHLLTTSLQSLVQAAAAASSPSAAAATSDMNNTTSKENLNNSSSSAASFNNTNPNLSSTSSGGGGNTTTNDKLSESSSTFTPQQMQILSSVVKAWKS